MVNNQKRDIYATKDLKGKNNEAPKSTSTGVLAFNIALRYLIDLGISSWKTAGYQSKPPNME